MSVTVSPGAASQLAVRTQPIGGPIGLALGVQPVVEIHDQAGNVVTTSTAPVNVAIGSGGGTISGVTTVNAIAGVGTFTGLSIDGQAGDRTLVFTSPGLASATSASFTMTPPPTPVIALDSTSVTFAATAGTSPPTKSITLKNGGGAPFTTVALDPPAYDAGQPSGWLTATLSGTAAPYTITLSAASASIAAGTYHATVRINAAGASNSPATISVTLAIAPSFSITYGATTEKVRLLDVGGAFAPAVSILSGGQPQPATSATYTSRATSVATVGPSGQITAVGPGETWVVATGQTGQADSVFVAVTRTSSGVVLRTDLTSYAVRAGDTTIVNAILDPRASGLAAANVAVGYETENSMFTIVSATIPTQSPMPIGQFASAGVIKVSVASVSSLTAPLTMLTLKVVTPRANLSGWFTLTVLDAVAPDGTVLTTNATSTRYPIIVR
jgi:hypothetical protein